MPAVAPSQPLARNDFGPRRALRLAPQRRGPTSMPTRVRGSGRATGRRPCAQYGFFSSNRTSGFCSLGSTAPGASTFRFCRGVTLVARAVASVACGGGAATELAELAELDVLDVLDELDRAPPAPATCALSAGAPTKAGGSAESPLASTARATGELAARTALGASRTVGARPSAVISSNTAAVATTASSPQRARGERSRLDEPNSTSPIADRNVPSCTETGATIVTCFEASTAAGVAGRRSKWLSPDGSARPANGESSRPSSAIELWRRAGSRARA